MEWNPFTLTNSWIPQDILLVVHWVNKGEKGFIEFPSDTYIWSIVNAFYQVRIYGWMATQDIFTGDKMKDFYYEL